MQPFRKHPKAIIRQICWSRQKMERCRMVTVKHLVLEKPNNIRISFRLRH